MAKELIFQGPKKTFYICVFKDVDNGELIIRNEDHEIGFLLWSFLTA